MLSGKLSVRQKTGWRGTAIAVGDSGNVFRSTNGKNWVSPNIIGKRVDIVTGRADTDGNGTIVVPVYDYGEMRAKLLVSGDSGATWETKFNSTTQSREYKSIKHVNGRWYLPVYGYGMVYSTDLNTWNNISVAGKVSNISSVLETCTSFDIVYNGSVYVMVLATSSATSGSIRVSSSSDGITWSTRLSITSGLTYYSASLAYGNGHFVLVASDGTIRESTNGITWNTRTPGGSSTADFTQIIYANNIFMAVAGNGTEDIQTSTDGITWTQKTPPGDIMAITYTGTNWVAVGYVSTAVKMWTSNDNGDSWTERTLTNQSTTSNGLLASLVHDSVSGKTFAFGPCINSYETLFLHVGTSNGTTWTKQNTFSGLPSTVYWRGIANNGNHIVAVGLYGNLMYSTNGGTSWTEVETGTFNSLYGVVYNSSMTPKWLAVGVNGATLSSADGINWTYTNTGDTNQDMYGLVCSGTTWVAYGVGGNTNGMVWTSTNGTSWTKRSFSTTRLSTPYYCGGIAWNGTTFVAAVVNYSTSYSVDAQTSTDGITWTSRGDPTGGYYFLISNVSWADGKFRIFSYYNQDLYTSTDGITWLKDSDTTFDLNDDVAGSHQQCLAYSQDSNLNKIFIVALGTTTSSIPLKFSIDGTNLTDANGIGVSNPVRAVIAYI